jgi:hypothetical protein
MKIGALKRFETAVNAYQTTLYQRPEDNSMQRLWNPKRVFRVHICVNVDSTVRATNSIHEIRGYQKIQNAVIRFFGIPNRILKLQVNTVK